MEQGLQHHHPQISLAGFDLIRV